MRMVVGIGLGVAIWLITAFIVSLFSSATWITMAASTIITCIIYFVWVFPYVAIVVPAHKAWILMNQFITQPKTEVVNSMGFREIHGQSEHHSGFHWKYPWEVFDTEVDMKRDIPVTSDPDRTYTLANGKTIKLDWQITVVPFPGFLVNFARTKEEDIKRRVKTRAEAFLQGAIGRWDKAEFDHVAIESLEQAFEKLFGGPEEIDYEEAELGVWTGTPEIYDIGNPQNVEEARNFVTEMEAVAQASKRIEEILVDYNLPAGQSLKMAMMGKRDTGVDWVELSGLIPGAGIPTPGRRQRRRTR